MITKQEQYKAALYCRLSQDDGQVGESGSIQTQRTLLKNYALENGYGIGDWYCEMKIAKMIQFENMNPTRKAENKGF